MKSHRKNPNRYWMAALKTRWFIVALAIIRINLTQPAALQPVPLRINPLRRYLPRRTRKPD